MSQSIDIVILTFNEERNIEACLQSVLALNTKIFIVDSGSTDRTLAICESYNTHVFHHPFENYASQRNWGLQNLPLEAEWTLNIDADHRVTEALANELTDLFKHDIDTGVNGFLISRQTLFMDKWIKHGGHYPTYHANLFRKGFGHCEEKLYDQHFVVTGKTNILKNDIIDIITDSVNTFIIRHNHWATLEARHLFALQTQTTGHDTQLIKPRLLGNPMERRRYMKKQYESFPLFIRPVFYFMIRYFIRLGFLDGTRGFIFHFLQGFWFRFLIDVKLYELRRSQNSKHMQR
ncbi:glycosyltransferase family 2 protein [Mucilaginibacter lappiensis]|uniref:Glycosyltransferase involved in cell wall biosynthesis n=1 Tax=Mucilaginibacter lappiensis TaxID=354630 RepID=A0A841JAA6_9SPHI|nr:glycosyltransferase family 2 protein [Mucilaginibacter lappiensis]MBB6128033.1 glycosyltransferase involved in cell wall biosynthesis [Mucilaginibacter lappiensis]